MVKKKEEDYSGTGYEDGQYPLFLYNRAVLRHEANGEITHFRLLFHSNNWLNNLLNDPIIRNIVINGSRVFDDFIVGVKSYMEVSSETPGNESILFCLHRYVHSVC